MKKLLSVITLLGALSGAAVAAPYTLPSPAGGALTSYDWQPVYNIDALYTVGAKSSDPDMKGLRGSLNLYSNANSSIRHQFSLNVAYQTGDSCYTDEVGRNKIDGSIIPVTLGYDLNIGITDNVFLYIGAKAGYAFADFDVKMVDEELGEQPLGAIDDSGMTFSVGLGLKVQCSDTVYVKAGYEYGRSYFDAEGGDDIIGGHTISVGIGCRF